MLSRRQFLQAAGIALAVAKLPSFASLRGLRSQALPGRAPHFETLYGRALTTVPVYAAPEISAPLITNLWSDTVTPILDTTGAWYRLPGGYARREGLQPMISPTDNTPLHHAPAFWGEVTSAVAVVRQWCAANAPIVTRVGHGGVLHVIDSLMLDGIHWYGVADSENGALLGWSQSTAWSPASVDAASQSLTLAIDQSSQRLTIFDGDQPLLSAPVSTGSDLLPGTYTVTIHNFTLAPFGEHHGVPWVLSFGANQHLSGAYWHNRFGQPIADASIQVTPALARWLYPRTATVIIS